MAFTALTLIIVPINLQDNEVRFIGLLLPGSCHCLSKFSTFVSMNYLAIEMDFCSFVSIAVKHYSGFLPEFVDYNLVLFLFFSHNSSIYLSISFFYLCHCQSLGRVDELRLLRHAAVLHTNLAFRAGSTYMLFLFST